MPGPAGGPGGRRDHGPRYRQATVAAHSLRLPQLPSLPPGVGSPVAHRRDVPQGRALVGLLDGPRPDDLPVLPGRDRRPPRRAGEPAPRAVGARRLRPGDATRPALTPFTGSSRRASSEDRPRVVVA